MESNKYLWQPRANRPIHIRVFHREASMAAGAPTVTPMLRPSMP
jgi:hypothetical protein